MQVGDELVERARAQVSFRTMPHSDAASFGFLAANDQHVRNFLDLGVANFCLQLFVTVVQMNAEASIFKMLGYSFRVLHEFSAYRKHGRLHGRKPGGEGSGIVLDQHAEEPLDRTKQRAMYHQRLVASTVLTNIFELEPPRQIEIELHGGELPRPPDGVHELHIDLRPVKRCFAGNIFVRDVHAL